MGYPFVTIQWISTLIALIALGIASYTDLKTREVPDWLSYGLVAVGIAANGLFSIIFQNASFILNSLLGLLIFFGIAAAMFYTGQWGGGDSKILMGIGALMGWNASFSEMPFLFTFLLNVLIVGAVYGMAWSIVLALRNLKKVKKEARILCKEKAFALAFRISISAAIVSLIVAVMTKDILFRIYWLFLGFMAVAMMYTWLFVKTVEKAAMLKFVAPDKLTEGDWIAEDVMVNGERICGPKDLGIEKKQIAKLMALYRKKKIKQILIKEGIPFVPSFFIAFLVSMVFGNLIVLFLQTI